MGKKQRKRRTQGSRRTASGRSERVEVLAPPSERMSSTLALLGEVAETAITTVMSTPVSKDGSRAFFFDVAMLERGASALKAVRVLCGWGHWEFAVAAVRQVFELLVNAEYLAAQPDRDAAMLRYAKFGLMQMARRELANMEYDQITGRPVDAERLNAVRGLLDAGFDEFKVPKKNGELWWAEHWAGKSLKQMVDASERTIRRDQYRLLFSEWSDQTHASPAVLLQTMLSEQISTQDFVRRDDIRIAETVGSAITHFIDLWLALPTVPPPDPNSAKGWFEHLVADAEKYGAAGGGRQPARN